MTSSLRLSDHQPGCWQAIRKGGLERPSRSDSGGIIRPKLNFNIIRSAGRSRNRRCPDWQVRAV